MAQSAFSDPSTYFPETSGYSTPKIEITTIDKTYNDPLARKLRSFLKQNKLSLKTKVCFSKELPLKLESKVIASCVFVPATAGMVIASEVVKDIIKKNKPAN